MAQFSNQAQLSYSGNVISSNVTYGELLDSLTADKNAVTGSYSIGEDLTYVVSLVSTGTTANTALTVSDDLGAYIAGGTTVYPLEYVAGSLLYYQNGTLMPPPAVASTTPLVITGVSVPAGGSTILIYKARVTEFADPTQGGTITNTAVIDGRCVTTPIRVTSTVTSATSPSLTITKSLEPTVVRGCGETLTYTFLIRNYGGADADICDNIVLTDTFLPVLHGMSVTLNGSVFPATSYAYSETTGVFTTVGGRITVPAGNFTRDPVTGAWTVTPGSAVLVVTGMI